MSLRVVEINIIITILHFKNMYLVRHWWITVVLLFVTNSLSAQVHSDISTENDSVYILFSISNELTHKWVANLPLTILDTNGKIITKGKTTSEGGNIESLGRTFNAYCVVPKNAKEIRIVVDQPTYVKLDKRISLNIGRRETFYCLPTIFVMPKSAKEIKTVDLDEVKVNASRIKMVMHGDTLVYNADAFQLSNGSMLDELIRRLPGVQLHGNQITVNGRQISELLVNGDDFFRGDPGVALQNLPAYTVKHIKVYERQNKADAFMGKKKQKGQDPLVMNVSLKKEYNRGFLANAVIGGGTAHRWMARLFALRYGARNRWAVFSNMNNNNDTQMPGSGGDWNPAWTANGLTTLRSIGVDYNTKSWSENISFNGNTRYLYEKINIDTYTATQNFLHGGDLFSRLSSHAVNRQQTLQSNNKLTYTDNRWLITFCPNVEYRKNNSVGGDRSATFTYSPFESYRGALLDSIFASISSEKWEQYLSNKLLQASLIDRNYFFIDGNLDANWRIPRTPEFLIIKSYNHYYKDNLTHHTLFGLTYGQQQGQDIRNKYSLEHNYSFSSNNEVQYFGFVEGSILEQYSFNYGWDHTTAQGRSALHRLDLLDNYRVADERFLHLLPSTTDSLSRALDANNSYYSKVYKNKHTLSTMLYFRLGESAHISFTPQLSYYDNEIRYERGIYRDVKRQNQWSYTHNIAFQSNGDRGLVVDYTFTRELPTLTSLLTYTDDVNPLAIWTGNPDLKATTTHTIIIKKETRLGKDKSNSNPRLLQYGLGWQVERNGQGNLTMYNRQTGATSTRPMNVNGNWQVSGEVNITSPLDKKRKFIFTSSTKLNYANSVDFITLYQQDIDPRSSVRNLNAKQNLSLNIQWSNWQLGVKADAAYLHATSKRPDFIIINAADVTYGVNVNAELPWQVKLGTDLSLYSRYGYSDPSLNTNDLVWNARLSRTFGQWTFMADGFDLLGQLSNVRRTLNAQGRTETWHNTVPRYFMLSVAYRFHFTPKKKG